MAEASRNFRVFVSSTFSDLAPEREALHRMVFPAIRRYCDARGARFQPVDLRWGVSEEAGRDQRTVQICLKEVDRCRALSSRPNFIVLLGDRYGWRPLPAAIGAQEFQRLLDELPSARNAPLRSLLTQWYRRDDNALARSKSAWDLRKSRGVFQLRPRKGRFADYRVWENEVERPLRAVLGGISATEHEIQRGVLDVPDAHQHVLCFARSIADMPRDRRAAGWLDLDADGQEDREATQMLGALKRRLSSHLARKLRTYDSRWTRSLARHDPPTAEEPCPITTDHLSALCADVERELTNIIDGELERQDTVAPVSQEIADHEAFLDSRTRIFVGRESCLRTVARFVAQEDEGPLVLHGAAGAGKSTLMARAAQAARRDRPRAHVLIRFVGWTPHSSNARTLLDGICREVCRAYGAAEPPLAQSYEDLVKEFLQLFALATSERPLVLFLDGLDQLLGDEGGRNLVWLPTRSPPNVVFIISCSSGPLLTALKRRPSWSNQLEIEAMTPIEANQLLDSWLGDADRTVNSRQRELLLRRFRGCPYPLYLKLAFEEACQWPAWTDAAEDSPHEELGEDVPRLLQQLFARLSSATNHGCAMTRSALAYLAASKSGLSEGELLDVLSLDSEVVNDFIGRTGHPPSDPGLPFAPWARLESDLAPYLTERHADGAQLISFFHKQLTETVAKEYLSGADGERRHLLLSHYFRAQSLGVNSGGAPNLRKLSELVHHLALGKQWDTLYETLTDFEFLEAKCRYAGGTVSRANGGLQQVYGGIWELLEDFRLALASLPED